LWSLARARSYRAVLVNSRRQIKPESLDDERLHASTSAVCSSRSGPLGSDRVGRPRQDSGSCGEMKFTEWPLLRAKKIQNFSSTFKYLFADSFPRYFTPRNVKRLWQRTQQLLTSRSRRFGTSEIQGLSRPYDGVIKISRPS